MSFPTSVTVSWWKIGALLRVSGADAGEFLQGQFTNELRGIAKSSGIYGLWLNRKGKVQADSFVLPATTPGEFWVASYFSPAAELRQRLEDFIIADDVSVEDVTPEWSGVSLLGEGAGAWLSAEERVGLVFSGRRVRGETWEWIFPTAERARVQKQLTGAPEIDAAELERRRILAGVPAVPADMGLGDLPAEGGLDAEAISYTKGCYLGQEVMARLKSLGQVRRRLMRVRGSGALPGISMPAKLAQEGRPVGELRSVAADGANGFVGLAMMSLVNLQMDRPLVLEALPSVALEIFPLTS